MKKIMLVRIILGFFCVISGYVSDAQNDSMNTLPPVVIYSKTNVNKAVLHSFDRQFKNAVDAQWYKMSTNFMATFITGDTKNNALFKKNGSLIYHISWGNEQQLPAAIKSQIQNAYADYNIITSININTGSRKVWVVNLEGLKKYIIVTAEDGELQEVKNLDKGM